MTDPVLTPQKKFLVGNKTFASFLIEKRKHFPIESDRKKLFGRFKGLKVKKFIDMIHFFFPTTFPIGTLARMRKWILKTEGLKAKKLSFWYKIFLIIWSRIEQLDKFLRRLLTCKLWLGLISICAKSHEIYWICTLLSLRMGSIHIT